MSSSSIIFPNIKLYLENVPTFLHIGPLSISLYGLIIGTAMLLAVLWCYNECLYYGVDQEHFLDLGIICIIAGIIGARLYYVIFSWDYYGSNLLDIFKIWEGGLGIYGGIILGIVAGIIVCRVLKMKFWLIADIACFGVLLGQIAGRWGNFFNREAFGEYTDSLLAMMLPVAKVRASSSVTDAMLQNISYVDNVPFVSVHPTFLYESLWNLGILIFLLIYRKYKRFDGELALYYVGLYGLGRFFIESLRTDQLQIGNTGIAISQVVAILFIIFAITMNIVFRVEKKTATPREKRTKKE